MKQIFVLMIMIYIGVSMLTVTPQGICSCQQLVFPQDCSTMPGCQWNENICSTISCSTYLEQTQCLAASKYCQWNVGPKTCSTFLGCINIIVTSQQNYKQCGQSNLQCLAYDGRTCLDIGSPKFNLICADYSSTCTDNYGTDGVCVLNKQTNTCEAITQCSQATQETQCQLLNQANGLSCQYVNGQCIQITSCNAFTTQTACKYYFPSLTSADMTLCQWSNSQCIEANNSLYLNSSNCLLSSGYNYRWLPTSSNPTVGICATCKIVHKAQQAQFLLSTQCQCKQFILQNECNIEYCQWNSNSNECAPIACSSVTSQSICISLEYCFWDYLYMGGCEAFENGSSCSSLPIMSSQAACVAQSAYCPAFSQGTCQNANSLNPCSISTTQQGCQNMIGSDGICRWINGICLPLTSCSQILDAIYCQNWKNLCQWNAKLQVCENFTCSSYDNNPTSCKYVISGFYENQIQLCRYNKQKNKCENAYSSLGLTQENCSTNTANTYRWSNKTINGMCVSCNQRLMINVDIELKSACQCSQFYLESDCTNSGYCEYNAQSEQCIQASCNNIESQSLCQQMLQCSWNPQSGCTTFNGCSSLNGENIWECANQNVQCLKSSNGTCQKIGVSDGMYCGWNETENCSFFIGQKSYSRPFCYVDQFWCVLMTYCWQATQEACTTPELRISCYWNNSTQQCQQLTCSYFTTQQSCKYFFQGLHSTEIIPCSWNQSQQVCEQTKNVLTQLNQTNCLNNTYNTYRWIPVGPGNGYCVYCNLPKIQIQVQVKNQCPCAYLVTQNDCQQAIECYWQNNKCVTYICSEIISQSICSSQENCVWSNGNCQDFNNNCTQLLGSNQLECISQQITCVGSNGINCINQLNQCEQQLTQNGCIEQVGSGGFCFWNEMKSACETITTCSQLPHQVCIKKQNACYYSNDSCLTTTCQQQFINTKQCGFIISLTNPDQPQYCQLLNGQCQSLTNPTQLNEETCYANFLGTTRWIPYVNAIESNPGGICKVCSQNLIPTFGLLKCQCIQYLTEFECAQAQNGCQWSTIDLLCQPIVCNTISNQLQCASQQGCAWNIHLQSCGEFQSCSQVIGKNLTLQNCLIYSTQCRGFNGQGCTNNPITNCKNFSEQMCVDIIGTDGPCIYNQTAQECQAIYQCQQITDSKICSFQNHICEWVNNVCTTINCSTIQTENACTYVITAFLTGNQQLCQWNSETSTCSNLSSTSSLTELTCQINTDFTYRWVSEHGVCAKCVINDLYIAGQCACNQIYSQYECQFNQNCIWTNNSCQKLTCDQITSQYACSTNPSCVWSLLNNQCSSFVSCQAIQSNGSNCALQSANCYDSSSTSCQDYKSTNCPELDNSGCERYYDCFWSNQSCQNLQKCDQIQSQQKCMNFPRFCIWESSSCNITNCSNFTKYNCNYYFQQFDSTSKSFCYWSESENSCLEVTNPQFQLNQENCFQNTLMTYRWTSSNSSIGYCQSCMQEPIQINASLNQVCSCKVLSQAECQLAMPFCIYQNDECVEIQSCDQIIDVLDCGQNKKCAWVNNVCSSFVDCSLIQSTTPLECYEFSRECPVFIPADKTCSPVESCDSFSQTDCLAYNRQVSQGFCYWNSTSCQSLTSCSQITDLSQCNVQKNRCQWNLSLNSCVQLTCPLLNLSNCQYLFQSLNFEDIQLCQWNKQTNSCQNSTISNNLELSYNDAECFVKTGHTYYYNGSSCVACYQPPPPPTPVSSSILTILLSFIIMAFA